MNVPEYGNGRGYKEEKEHGAKEFPFNIYICSIPLDFEQVRVHWHEEMEIIAVKRGRGIVTAEKETYSAKAGEMIMVFPGQLHGIRQDGNEAMEYENIIFRPSMLAASGEDVCDQRFLIPIIAQRIMSPLHVTKDMAVYEEFSQCIARLDRLSGEMGYGYQMAVKGTLFELLYLAFQTGKVEEEEHPKKARERIKQLLGYMEEHYGEPLTVEEAAALCYYSPSHFMKYFKQYMGVPFVRYLNDYRLTKAAYFLAAGEDSVTAAAQSCGFDNLSYFNRLFRQKFGMTPGKYRETCR